MFECYNKEKIIQKAYEIKNLPKEEINKLEFSCPECKDKLNFIQEFPRRIYGKIAITSSHFKHKTQTNCEGYYPLKHGESKEHYNTKMELLERLHSKKPIFKIGNLLFEMDLNDFEIDWKETKEEIKAIENRQADILLKLKTPNAMLGNGIAIEIKKSESQQSIENKKLDYCQKGYSLCQTTNGYELEIKETFPETILTLFELQKEQIEYFEEKIKLFEKDFRLKAQKNNWNCTNCEHAAVDDLDTRILDCWKPTRDTPASIRTGKKQPIKRSNFTPCEDYCQRSKLKKDINLVEDSPRVKCDRDVVE
jgi:hypothetical protein